MTTDCVGGVWTYSVELATALAARGVHVSLATMGPRPSDDQRQQVRAIRNVDLHESDFKLEWMDEPWSDVARAGDWLLELADWLDADVVHLNGFAHGALPRRVPCVVVGHSCVLSWWRAVKGEDAPGRYDRYREQVTRGLRAADVVVAPTNAMLDALRTHYGPLRRTAVIDNARDPKLFAAPPQEQKEEFVFAAGRVWDEAKNVAALERNAARLAWPICIAGEDSREKASGGGSDAAIHLGQLQAHEVARWMLRASIYALPARYEPFGLSVLEAAMSGCALVLGDIESLRENWDGVAEFVAPGDEEALHRAITDLIEDDVRRRRLAERAQQRARRFSPERMGREYLSLYQSLPETRAEATSAPALAMARRSHFSDCAPTTT